MRFREVYEMRAGRVDPAPGLEVPNYLQRHNPGPVFDVTDLCRGQPIELDTEIAFPFDVFILYSKKSHSQEGAFVCVEVEPEDGEHWDYGPDGFRPGARYVKVSLFIGIEHHPVIYLGWFAFVVDPEGRLVPDSFYGRCGHEETSFGLFGVVLHTCSLFACKNIRLFEKYVPKKLRKKQERKHGHGGLREYVLTITVPGKQKQYEGGSTSVGTSVPLHICRGHFKTFTDEKPLLGKHTGKYWWQPHVRGDEKNGTIKKDYRVKEAKQPNSVDGRGD